MAHAEDHRTGGGGSMSAFLFNRLESAVQSLETKVSLAVARTHSSR